MRKTSSIVTRVLGHANLRPSAIAIDDGAECVSYQQLSGRVSLIAASLLSRNLVEGALVCTYFESSADYVATLLGVMAAGCAFVPLQFDWPVERLASVLKFLGSSIVVCSIGTTDTFVEKLGSSNLASIRQLNEEGMTILEFSQTCHRATPDSDRAYVLFTSGSTGTPKAIEGSGKGLLHFLEWELAHFNLGPDTKSAQVAPISFDVSLRDILAPLLAGGTVCIPLSGVRSNPLRLLEWMAKVRISLLHIVPSWFRVLLRELEDGFGPHRELECIRNILLAGEPARGSDTLRWRNLVGAHAKFTNLYGPSETTLAKFYYPVEGIELDDSILPLGYPLPDTQLLLLREDGNPCGKGETGEIHIKTPYASRGYYRQTELTSERFLKEDGTDQVIYRTGDFGTIAPGGELLFHGRRDSQVKIRGNRVELLEIEEAIKRCHGISEAIVLAPPARHREPELICYFVGHTDHHNLAKQLRTCLPEYMVPGRYIRLEILPLNSNGKVDRTVLQDMSTSVSTCVVEPVTTTEIESLAREWWKNALVLDRIPDQASFAELGGSSLAAMRVISKAYRKFGIQLCVLDVFRPVSVSEFARIVECAEVDRHKYQPIAPRRVSGPTTLSFAQRRMWELSRYKQSKLAYNETAAIDVTGIVDKNICQAVFYNLVQRHSILRSQFRELDGLQQQVVLPFNENRFRLNFIDVSNCPNPYEAARECMLREKSADFHLGEEPLIRAFLIKVASDRHIIFAVFFHIIMDQRSHEILIAEACQLYGSYARSLETMLLSPHRQYQDFADWEQRIISTSRSAFHRKFWTTYLSLETPPLTVRGSQRRPPIKSYSGANVTGQFDLTILGRLGNFATRYGATLAMICTAYSYVLLSLWTGSTDIVVGTPVTTRIHPDIEDTVGLFMNTLPLRVKMNGLESFSHLLEEVKSGTFRTLEHQMYPFEQIANDLGAPRSFSRSPLFDIMVATYDDPLSKLSQNINDSNAHYLWVGSQYAKFDLTLYFVRRRDSLQIIFEYSTAIIDEGLARHMLEDCLDLIRRTAGHDFGLVHCNLLSDRVNAERSIECNSLSTT